MLYDVSLAIEYAYSAPANRSRTLLHLSPPDLPGLQKAISTSLHLDPAPDEHSEGHDFFGNRIAQAAWHGPIAHLSVTLNARIWRLDPPRDGARALRLSQMPAALAAVRDLGPRSPLHFLTPSAAIPAIPDVTAYATRLVRPGMTAWQAVRALGHALHRDMRFDANATAVDTPPAEAFAQRHGVCQDFAQVMIAGLRGLGIPAGYVSGFLRTDPPPGQPRLEGADAMHAWISAWTGPDSGWMGFDPTNDQPDGLDYLQVAFGRDYLDVAPVRGAIRSAGGQISAHRVDVVPVSGAAGMPD